MIGELCAIGAQDGQRAACAGQRRRHHLRCQVLQLDTVGRRRGRFQLQHQAAVRREHEIVDAEIPVHQGNAAVVFRTAQRQLGDQRFHGRVGWQHVGKHRQQAVAVVRCGQGIAALGFAPVAMVGRQPQQILQGNAQQLDQVLSGGQHGDGALERAAHPGGRRACRAGAQQPVQGPAHLGAGRPGAETLGELGVGPQVPRRGGGGVAVVLLWRQEVDVVVFGDQVPVFVPLPG